MDDREKLIELVDKARRYAANKCHSFMSCAECDKYGEYDGNCRNAYITESLITNGVTFATDKNVGDKWIPVTERLPDVAWRVLVTDGTNVNFGYTLCFEINGVSPWCTLSPVMPHNVTHWMPLPEPPKGE